MFPSLELTLEEIGGKAGDMRHRRRNETVPLEPSGLAPTSPPPVYPPPPIPSVLYTPLRLYLPQRDGDGAGLRLGYPASFTNPPPLCVLSGCGACVGV